MRSRTPHRGPGALWWHLCFRTVVGAVRLSRTPLGKLLAGLAGIVLAGLVGGRYLPNLSGLVLYLAPLLVPLSLLVLVGRVALDRWYDLGPLARLVVLPPLALVAFLVAWVVVLIPVSLFLAGWQHGLNARPGPSKCPGLIEVLPTGEHMCGRRWGEPGTAPFFHFQM